MSDGKKGRWGEWRWRGGERHGVGTGVGGLLWVVCGDGLVGGISEGFKKHIS